MISFINIAVYLKPNCFAVDGINCQNPFAPLGERVFSKPLSMTAKYLKSSGTPSSFKIASILGNHLLAF